MKRRNRFWHLPATIKMFLIGDRGWSEARLILFALILLIFIFLSWLAFYQPHSGGLNLLDARNLRYLVFPLAAVVGAFLVAINYVRDIYDLNSFRKALRFLIASVFGIRYPHLSISEGRKVLRSGEVNTLDVIGGPGYLSVAMGSVALIERLTAPSKVVGAGFHFLSRGERVKEVTSLEDQDGHISELPVTTKDGIEVVVHDIKYRYRLRTGKQPGDYVERTPGVPYPFSVEAMRDLTYNRTVGVKGLTPWAQAVRLAVDSVISDYISQNRFDRVMTPRMHENDPRAEIPHHFTGRGPRQRLRNLGAELVWVDIGYIEPADKGVSEQHVENWEAAWVGDASVDRAYGEAQRLACQELGRAEAQAALLASIASSLEDVDVSPDTQVNLRNVILVRTAQILDALTEQCRKGDQKS